MRLGDTNHHYFALLPAGGEAPFGFELLIVQVIRTLLAKVVKYPVNTRAVLSGRGFVHFEGLLRKPHFTERPLGNPNVSIRQCYLPDIC